MMKRRIWLKAISLWQILGGAVGGAILLDDISRLQVPVRTRVGVLAVVILTCVVSVLAGWGLLQGRRIARIPSLLVQALQVLGVGTTGFMGRFCLGPYVFLYVINGTVGVEAGFRPQLQWYWHGSPVAPHVIVNLLAVLCFMMLLKWDYITEPVPESPAPGTEAPVVRPASTAWPPIDWPK